MSLTGPTVTKYYYLGSQRVAMRQGSSTVYFLLGDHLGSTSVTASSSGGKVAELRYHPWGGTRYSSGTTPTARRYTGQIEDAAIGLYFYNARYYDPALGRFLQADTIVPAPANPQSLNRYAYVLNNPLRYTDPSGHASEWDWQNRWYNAHGYFWNSSTNTWSVVGNPVFADIDIAREVIGRAGVTLGGWMSWSGDNIKKVAYGVAKFGQKLSNGIDSLKGLLPGEVTVQLVAQGKSPWYCGGGNDSCAPPPLLYGRGSLIYLHDFDGKSMVSGAELFVHELAHVIDWKKGFSRSWADAHAPLTDYAKNPASIPIFARPKWEVWAEAVTVFVFGHYAANGGYVSSYKSSEIGLNSADLAVQMDAMQKLLEGW